MQLKLGVVSNSETLCITITIIDEAQPLFGCVRQDRGRKNGRFSDGFTLVEPLY
jgi:hypothetical protein